MKGCLSHVFAGDWINTILTIKDGGVHTEVRIRLKRAMHVHRMQENQHSQHKPSLNTRFDDYNLNLLEAYIPVLDQDALPSSDVVSHSLRSRTAPQQHAPFKDCS
jgi:hypothetical protein